MQFNEERSVNSAKGKERWWWGCVGRIKGPYLVEIGNSKGKVCIYKRTPGGNALKGILHPSKAPTCTHAN